MTPPTELELLFFNCIEKSDLPTNGGYLSTTRIETQAMNNLWPHVLRDERDNGGNLKRKVALKIHQDGSGRLATTEFCLDGPTLGHDRIIMYPAGAKDTQADIGTPSRIYCGGSLAQPVVAGSKTIVINLKVATDADGFKSGDDFRLSDKFVPESAAGNVEFHTIDTTSLSGLQLTVVTVRVIANDYAAYDADAYTGGKVGVIYKAGETRASHGVPVVTTAEDGEFNTSVAAVSFNNMGADEHQSVFIMTDDVGNFTCTSDRHSNLPTGNLSVDYSPLHPFWKKKLFTIPAAAWIGTWKAGDRMVIDFSAAAKYVWEERDIPENCAPITNNRVILINRSEPL